MHKQNVLVTLADKNYIEQAKQLFASAYLAGEWQDDFLLISYDIPKKDLAWFENRGIIVKSFPKIDLNLNSNRYYSNKVVSILATKLYLFSDYFKQWNKVMFLDSDIIVKKRLDYFTYTSNFNAVKDFIPSLSFQFREEYNNIIKKAFKKYDLKENSFNSGVMVFSTNIIKKNTFQDLISLFEKYKEIVRFPEQAILNLYFYKKWTDLGYTYNGHIPLVKNKSPRLIHFIGAPGFKKPWEKSSDFYELWSKNINKSQKIDFRKKIKKRYYNYPLEKLIDTNTNLSISMNYNSYIYNSSIKKNEEERRKYIK